LIFNDLGEKCGEKDFFVGKESLFNFAPIKKKASKYAVPVRMAYHEAFFYKINLAQS
jgi:hypothetical protein